MGWILETNKAMNRAMEAMGGEIVKKYRVYERVLLTWAGAGRCPARLAVHWPSCRSLPEPEHEAEVRPLRCSPSPGRSSAA